MNAPAGVLQGYPPKCFSMPERGHKPMLIVKRTGIAALGLMLAASFILFSSGCDRREKVAEVKLEKREALQPEKKLSQEQPLRIAVGAMITPRAGFAYYRRLLDYIGEKLGKPVQFVSKEKYEEVNELLKNGDLDIAFVCSGPYVSGHDEFGLDTPGRAAGIRENRLLLIYHRAERQSLETF